MRIASCNIGLSVYYVSFKGDLGLKDLDKSVSFSKRIFQYVMVSDKVYHIRS
jgi:hypothetical protein